MGYRLWGRTEKDTTEVTSQQQQQIEFTFFFLFFCPLYDISVSQFENINFLWSHNSNKLGQEKNACQSPSINLVFGRPLDLSETELLICKTGQKMPTIYFHSIIMRTKKKKMYVKQM